MCPGWFAAAVALHVAGGRWSMLAAGCFGDVPWWSRKCISDQPVSFAMRTTNGGAASGGFRSPVLNTAFGAMVVPRELMRAAGTGLGIMLSLAVAAGVAGCAGGGGGGGVAADDSKAGSPAVTTLVADEEGMSKAAKNVAEMFEKQRAADAGRRVGGGERAAAVGGSGGVVPPTGDIGPVTSRDPAGTAGSGNAGAMQPGIRDGGFGRGVAGGTASGYGVAGNADGSRSVRAEANVPVSLDDNGLGVGRGRTNEAARVVRARLLTEHTRGLAVLLEQEALAPVMGKATGRRAGAAGEVGSGGAGTGDSAGSASGSGALVSSAMVLAALAPVDPSAAEGFSRLRNRLDEDQVHIADTVRRIVDAARNGEPKPGEGKAGDGRTADGMMMDGRAQPTNSLSVPKASVSIAGSGVSVLSQVILDSAITLDEQRGLRIGALALTSAVESFGRYTPMDTSRFVAGRKAPILVYTELANFSNNAGDGSLDDNGEGKFSVMLVQTIELRSEADGTVALDYGTQEFASRARAARRDLFVTRRIELPANLTIGTYVLNVRVKDRATGSETENKLKLEVGAR